MTLYYSNQTSLSAYLAANMAQNDMWLPAPQIAGLIRALRAVNFSSRASRNVGLAMILGLVPSQPYLITGSSVAATGDRRFSTQGNSPALSFPVVVADVYINASCDGWQTVLAQCQSSLQFADRPSEKTMLTDGGTVNESESVNAPNPQVSRSQYNDAFRSFTFSVLTMIDLFNNGIGSYNYATFEAQYGLIYTTVAQTPVLPPAIVSSADDDDDLDDIIDRLLSKRKLRKTTKPKRLPVSDSDDSGDEASLPNLKLKHPKSPKLPLNTE